MKERINPMLGGVKQKKNMMPKRDENLTTKQAQNNKQGAKGFINGGGYRSAQKGPSSFAKADKARSGRANGDTSALHGDKKDCTMG